MGCYFQRWALSLRSSVKLGKLKQAILIYWFSQPEGFLGGFFDLCADQLKESISAGGIGQRI